MLPHQVSCPSNVRYQLYGSKFLVARWSALIISALMHRRFSSCKSRRQRGPVQYAPSRPVSSHCKLTSKSESWMAFPAEMPSFFLCSLSDLYRYVDDILRATSPDVEQVVIEPDGAWSSPNDADAAKPGGVTPATDDDDLIEITEPGISPVKQEPMPASVMLERTPAQSQSQSRETSTPSSAVRMSTKKRSAAQVIDLTGSDDEDDESPVPPSKRPALSFNVRGDPHQPVTSSPLHSRTYPPSY